MTQFQRVTAAVAIALAAAAGASSAQRSGQLATLRLYVFDCGTLHYDDADAYQLKKSEVARTDMSMACFLVVHPRGTLMWDVGAVADRAWRPGSPMPMRITLPDGTDRVVTMRKTLESQLKEAGYAPPQITYIALSHFHWDHVANANQFASSTWLARKTEHDLMFAATPPERSNAPNYSALAKSRTVLLEDKADYDVFGDGTVVLKPAPGHTPSHQVLFVNLPKTGPVVLSGDLYHYPEERTLNRLPVRDYDQKQTAASRAALEAFLKQKGAQLWIQHDIAAHEKLKKAPAYYE
jgi:N-acyl homoserine lactone hydrolase